MARSPGSKGVFRRFLELALDERSAKKTERDTQASLRRATDPKVVGRNLSDFARSAARLTAEATASVVGYAVALTKLTERGGQVLGVQRAFEAAVGDTDAALTKLRRATGGLISDYDLMVQFNNALSLGAVKNIDQFAEMSEVALRLGRALGVDATFAMDSLVKGIGRGSALILDNLGIMVEGAVTVESAMAAARETIDRLGGDAVTNADRLSRITVQFTNLKDEVATFLAQSDSLRVAFSETGNVLETLVLALQSEDRDTMVEAFKIAGSLAGTAFAASFFEAAEALFRSAFRLFTPKFLEDSKVASWLNLFGIVANLSEKAADSGWETVNALLAQGDALRRMLETERELAGIRGGRSGPAPVAGAGAGGIPGFTARRGVAAPSAPGALTAGGVPIFNLTPQTDQAERFRGVVDTILDGMGAIESAGQSAAFGIQSAFEDAFAALGQEGEGFAGFFESIFRGTAAGAIAAIAQLASVKVAENIAQAVEKHAESLGFAATGNLASAAAAAASAKEHLIAAAKWAIVGGAAGAAASAIGGSGGGAATFRGNNATGRRVDQLEPSGADIIVYVDGVDPSNPRHQRLAGEAARKYQERYGGRIITKPRNAAPRNR